jgi:hypothetical protein
MHIEDERRLRWMLKKLSPAAYAQHHAEVLLEALYQSPKEEQDHERVFITTK